MGAQLCVRVESKGRYGTSPWQLGKCIFKRRERTRVRARRRSARRKQEGGPCTLASIRTHREMGYNFSTL